MQLKKVFLIIMLAAVHTGILWRGLACIGQWDKDSGIRVTNRELPWMFAIVLVYCGAFFESTIVWAAVQALWMTYLFFMAITDAQTGYVYTRISAAVNVLGGTALFIKTILCEKPINKQEWLLIWIYLFMILAMGILKGIGTGDIPIFISILLYHLLYSPFPGLTVVSLLLLSQLLFCVTNIHKLLKQSEIPLVPYLFFSHFVTVCLFIP